MLSSHVGTGRARLAHSRKRARGTDLVGSDQSRLALERSLLPQCDLHERIKLDIRSHRVSLATRAVYPRHRYPAALATSEPRASRLWGGGACGCPTGRTRRPLGCYCRGRNAPRPPWGGRPYPARALRKACRGQRERERASAPSGQGVAASRRRTASRWSSTTTRSLPSPARDLTIPLPLQLSGEPTNTIVLHANEKARTAAD